MDVLSRLLASIRVRSPILAELHIGSNVTVNMGHGQGSPFHYVMAGSVRMRIKGESILLQEGDLALLPGWDQYYLEREDGGPVRSIADIVHEQGLPNWLAPPGLDAPLRIMIGDAPRPTRLLSINFATAGTSGGFLANALPRLIRFSPSDQALHVALAATLELLLRGLRHPEPGFTAVAARTVELLVVQALQFWLLHSEHPVGWARGVSDDHIKPVLEAIYADPGAKWGVTSMARLAGQSRSSFAETFRQAMGESPVAHLRRLRMHLAAEQLASTRKSISKIAAELGYSSSYSFVRAFREEMQTTAAAYRRSKRAANSTAQPEVSQNA